MTALQILIVAVIYYFELAALGYHANLSSILIYAGSANLALFVSFTPAAIGIRESFIYFSQSMHDIPTEYIFNTSLLDRSVYLMFLIILLAFSSSLHLKAKLIKSK